MQRKFSARFQVKLNAAHHITWNSDIIIFAQITHRLVLECFLTLYKQQDFKTFQSFS